MNVKLTPAQVRALLAIHAAGTPAQCTNPPRADVLRRLLVLGMLTDASDAATLTVKGTNYATAMAAAPETQTPAAPLQSTAVDPGALGVYLANNLPAVAPQGAAQAVLGALADLTDRDRVAVLAFLAAPAGAAYLGQVKDELVAVNRLGRTYAETAEVLGLSVTAINKAVSRRAARGMSAARKA